MRAWETVGRARAPDGTEMTLCRRGEEWVVRYAGRVLMSSRAHGSEDALATLALGQARRLRTIVVGGLGLGYTLRAALDRAPPEARVVVAEVVPEIVAWNRGPVAHLCGRPLDDPRVSVQVRDVAAVVAEARGAFDALLLDVDNAPGSPVLRGNDRLYGEAGVRACRRALADGGVLAVWSAGPDDQYLARLRGAGLGAETRAAAPLGAGPGRHVVFLASKVAATGPCAVGPAPRRTRPGLEPGRWRR
jgi:spermidine synthase